MSILVNCILSLSKHVEVVGSTETNGFRVLARVRFSVDSGCSLFGFSTRVEWCAVSTYNRVTIHFIRKIDVMEIVCIIDYTVGDGTWVGSKNGCVLKTIECGDVCEFWRVNTDRLVNNAKVNAVKESVQLVREFNSILSNDSSRVMVSIFIKCFLAWWNTHASVNCECLLRPRSNVVSNCRSSDRLVVDGVSFKEVCLEWVANLVSHACVKT